MLAEAFASDPAWSSQLSPYRLPHVHHEAASNKVSPPSSCHEALAIECLRVPSWQIGRNL